MLARLRAAGLVWPTILSLLALGVLLSLGTWQWQRKAWKDALVARIEARAKEAPLGYSEALSLFCRTRYARAKSTARDCEYLQVRMRGTFDYDNERYIFAGPIEVDGRVRVGYWVFTPFVIDQGNAPDRAYERRVYINRGFVPESSKRPEQRQSNATTEVVEIAAQVRRAQARGWFDAENNPAKNAYYVRDPLELAARTRSTGGKRKVTGSARIGDKHYFYLELLAARGQTGLPRPLAGTIAIPNRHLEYALTWWGLAATLIGVYFAFAWGRLKGAR